MNWMPQTNGRARRLQSKIWNIRLLLWEKTKGGEQIIAMGIDEEVVKQAARLVDTSEYKRCQVPPGVKITPRTFGRDRRLPITN